MKFDVVVGNPPYQEENVGSNNQAAPVYNYFYALAEKVAQRYALISPARFLSNQGATPKAWNKKMLEDEHINIEYFNSDSSKVFPSVDIKGGVVVVYRDQERDFGAIHTFIPSDKMRAIFHKVKLVSTGTLSSLVYSPDSYRFTNVLFEEHPELIGRTDGSHAKAIASSVFDRYPEIFFQEKPLNDGRFVQILGRRSGKRMYLWIKRAYINAHSNLDKWKVFIPGANGTGAFGETLSNPVVAGPGVGHNQTFVSLGAFDTEFEADALLKYIETKFGRAMLDIMKTTQNNQSRNSWSTVPLQDFTAKSDIDWTKKVAEINQQLYSKYGLNSEEMDFVDTTVKSMS